jgi:D-alanyl-D-alanine dipeptidase
MGRESARASVRASARAARAVSVALATLSTLSTLAAIALAGPAAPVPAGAADAGRPAAFVDVATLAPGIAVDMRYATARNFLGRRVRGYVAPRCLLARPAALALAEVARDLAPSNLGLKVYDCYRPRRAVADFVAWARDAADTATAAVHYPAIPKSELFKQGYIAFHSGHSRGSTVDLTLVPLPVPARPPTGVAADCRAPAPAGALAADGSLDMGTAFDCFDERSHTDDPRISPQARHNRALLRSAMEKRGFVNYQKEWWHFTLSDEPYPDTSFDFEIR